MRSLICYVLIATLFIFGCSEESHDPNHQVTDVQGLNQGDQQVISEITLDGKVLTFIHRDGNVGVLERYLPGEKPILGEEFEGLTFAEIHQKLAPEVAVPAEIAQIDERFEMESDVAEGYQNQQLIEGNHIESKSGTSSREAGLNDIWFRDNYCNVSSFWNGYKACLLNRYGPGSDWGWANCTRSRVYVYPFQGGQVHLQGKVDGSTLFDADLLAGYVYTYYMFSGTNFWGCRQTKKHYYSITNTSGDGWHWNLRSNTNC